MSDTPRTDAAKKIVLGGVGGDWEVVHIAFSRQLERELNAANQIIRQQQLLEEENLRLTAKVAQLYEGAEEQRRRIKRLEEAGDHLESNLKEIWEETVSMQKWAKAKEAKL